MTSGGQRHAALPCSRRDDRAGDIAGAEKRITAILQFLITTLLALAGIILAAPVTRSEPRTIKLDLFMVDYKFIPNHLAFQPDVHYRLHMENHGKETHEVTAPTFFATAKIDNPEVLNPEHTEVVVQPGETKDLFLTAHRPGTYDLRCSDHDWNGMVGGITVE